MKPTAQGLILVQPKGGLGNRLRVVALGRWLGSVTGREVRLIWHKGSEWNAGFSDLFQVPDGLTLQNSGIRDFILSAGQSLRDRLTGNGSRLLPASFCGFRLIGDSDLRQFQQGKEDILDVISKNPFVYIQTCLGFGGIPVSWYQIELVGPLQKEVEAVVRQFAPHTLGLHIRRTDNQASITKTPDWLFIQRIQEELKTFPDACFFLCTDDQATETRLKSLFGNQIQTRPKNFSRKSPDGARDAVVDLWALAKTQRIIGSYWSSFSELAHRIGQVPLEIPGNGKGDYPGSNRI